MTRGLINGTAISNGMLSWKVSHREPPALPLTDSQERKEEGREEGRRGQEGRKRGQAFCPDPCQFPFANDSGKGVMIFHSEEICQVSGNTTRTGDDNGPKANAFRYFCPPTPPPPHILQKDGAPFIIPPPPSPRPIVKHYCGGQKTSVMVWNQRGASQLHKKYLFVRVRRWKRYPGRHSQMSMNAAVGCILPTFLKLGPCGLWSRLPHHGHPPVTMCWVCWASSWAGYNPLSTTTSTYPWKQDVLPLRGLLVPNCLPTTPKQRTSLTSPDVPSAQWLPSHLKCHCVCYTVVFPLPPQNVKLLKGSSGTRASLWHSQDFFLLTWSWGCSACSPWKLINNTRAFFAPIPWSKISLWPTVPGNFHIFNNHKYATPSIYFEQKKKKSNKS